MLATIFKPSNESSNVKQLVSYILHNMDMNKYQQFIQKSVNHPTKEHKFVVLEYVESPIQSRIHRSERLPGSSTSIHSIIQNPDFDTNMQRLFVNSKKVGWYTRRKYDFSKPDGPEQLSDIRQLILLIEEQPPEEDYSDMPPLVSAENTSQPVLNPEQFVMPEISPIPSYTFDIGVNQTIWNPNLSRYTLPAW
jgi:hypothetical protein